MLKRHFTDLITDSIRLLDQDLPQPAYDLCLKSSHMFNLLEARGAISVTEREAYISKIRDVARRCSLVHLKISNR